MPFVVCVLKPADGGFRGADTVGKLLLGQPVFGPKLVNLAGNLGVDDLLLVFLLALRIARNVAVVQKLRGLLMKLLLCHGPTPV